MLHIDKTPRIPDASSNRDNPIHREVHKSGPERAYNEELIGETRRQICSKYNIPINHQVVDLESTDGEQRVIRAFSIIKSISDKEKIYYAEGHRSHFELFQEIISQFKEELDLESMADIDLDQWTVKKGFLDPNNNNFRSFPNARAGLLKIYSQNQEINGSSDSENNLPNWFLSADSETTSRMGKLDSDPIV